MLDLDDAEETVRCSLSDPWDTSAREALFSIVAEAKRLRSVLQAISDYNPYADEAGNARGSEYRTSAELESAAWEHVQELAGNALAEHP